jgi:hypothetical protein
MIPANPTKFCVKFRPPTIAIVYELANRPKKYVHEILLEMKENTDLSKLCEELF